MTTYYFMVQGLVPEEPETEMEGGPFRVVPRKWQVGIWDWALLATEHDLKIPYQSVDLASQTVNLEIAVEASDPVAAVSLMRAFRLFLAANSVAPVATPTISTHSINDFSGIKQFATDSTDLRHERAKVLAAGEERVWMAGVRSGTVNMWPDQSRRNLDAKTFDQVVRSAEAWIALLAKTPQLRVLEDAALTAPEIVNLGQGILQMWTGLESLFPTIHAELSFRLALYLAQLDPSRRRDRFRQAKDAYKIRSKVAHGHDMSEPTEQNRESWSACWLLLHSTAQAIVVRGDMPTADVLEAELLA